MGAYSEFVDVISLPQTVGDGRPVTGAYSESVGSLIESTDHLKADLDSPPLGFGLHPTSASLHERHTRLRV